MHHSIIIAHRNRNEHLKWCLWSILRSEVATGIGDYQIIVVDANSEVEPEPPVRGMVTHDRDHGRMFNKSRCLNRGIEYVRRTGRHDDVVTILDADAIVSRGWLSGIRCLESPAITMLFYRARLLPVSDFRELAIHADQAELYVNGWFRKYDDWYCKDGDPFNKHYEWFRRYDRYPCCGEFYGDTNSIYQGPAPPPPFGRHVFGHSQLSIRLGTLGTLRFDERLEGRGCEDQMFTRAVWRAHGDDYCGALLTDPQFAMFHIDDRNEMVEGNDWDCPVARARNQEIYKTS